MFIIIKASERTIMKKKALFITCTGFKDHELVYPYYRVLGAGFQATVVADKKDSRNRVYGFHGVNMPCDVLLPDFAKDMDRYFNEYDLLILPGGSANTEQLRQVKPVLEFVKRWDDSGKCMGIICHAAQVLINAKMLKGRTISGFYAIQTDIENAGATWVDGPYVVDRNIIASPHYDHMGPWMEKVLEVYEQMNG